MQLAKTSYTVTVIFILVSGFFLVFFNRRILLHGKNSQKRDNIKKKDNKTTNNLTYVHK